MTIEGTGIEKEPASVYCFVYMETGWAAVSLRTNSIFVNTVFIRFDRFLTSFAQLDFCDMAMMIMPCVEISQSYALMHNVACS